MIEAVKLWNEPNNISHWDFEVDPGWRVYADLVKTASAAVHGENPGLTRVLGGISPIDAGFIKTLGGEAVQCSHPVPPRQQRVGQERSDESGATSDQDVDSHASVFSSNRRPVGPAVGFGISPAVTRFLLREPLQPFGE